MEDFDLEKSPEGRVKGIRRRDECSKGGADFYIVCGIHTRDMGCLRQKSREPADVSASGQS